MKIAENIKAIRLAKQIKQQVIADALGIEVTAVSNFENGKRDIKVSELDAIASSLGVSVIDLMTYPEKYAPIENDGQQKRPVKAVLQIELTEEKQNQVFKLMFGENNVKILTE